MSRKKKYRIGVVFGHTIMLDVKASDLDDARDKAEYEASRIFKSLLEDHMLGMSDFDYEAYRQ